MAPPLSLSIVAQKWDSFEVGWKGPDQGWLPTLYKAKACRKEKTSNCPGQDLLSDRRSFEAEDLSEFTEYDVAIEGILEPLACTTSAKISVFTCRYYICTKKR
ncbi:fibronectin type-III domain-containing protein [Trichonephila clavipes]|nr:fibronectin type-III domain-containing protein [Trichonephila clavipes]